MEIRQSRDTDEEGIRALFKVSFNKDMSHDEWVWKYKSSPFGSVSYVVIKNNNIVAHYGGIKYNFFKKNEMLVAYQTCDVMTHPGFRGMFFGRNPLIVKTATMFYRDYDMDFAFGFPSERHARLQAMLLGGSLPRKVVVFKKDIHSTVKNSWKYPGIELPWDTIRVNDIDMLWEKCSEGYPLSIEKNSRYFMWRYKMHPSEEYKIIALRSMLSRKLKALAVVKLKDHEMHIHDFLIPKRKMFVYFWKALESLACKMHARSIITWANMQEDVSRFLMKSGYTHNEDIPCSFRAIKSERISTSDFFSGYCYRIGDYDAS